MKGTSTTTRSSGRTLQFSFYRSRRVTTYVKPPHLRRSVIGVKQALRGLAALAALQFAAPPVFALPTGEQVVAGSASVSRDTAQTTMQINQGSSKAIVNWTGFSIKPNETVNIVQPSSSSVLLNRVVPTEISPGVWTPPPRSELLGAMNANGKVFLVNPTGILVGRTAQFNVGSFVASTLNIRNEDFLNDIYRFYRDGAAGSVVNEGRINITTPWGYAALIGPQTVNHGVIKADTVALAAGNGVALDMIGDRLISVRVDEAALGALALNTGTIEANGGSVYLTARSADALLDTVVNNTGIIRATSLIERNGLIVLDGGSAGVVANSGTLDVSGTEAGATGGTVKVLGEYVGLFNGSRIDASGDAGGGSVMVGGNFYGFGPEQNAKETYVASDASINADAVNSGNGGQVAIWSDNGTEFYGSVSARGGAQSGDGGFVEISGKDSLVFAGNVDTSAPKGRAGNLLLDPTDIFIIDGAAGTGDQDANLQIDNEIAFGDADTAGNTVTVGQLQAQANNNITLQATNTIRVGAADTTTAATVDLSASLTTNTLTLSAGNGSGGAGNVTFNTGSTITTGGGSVVINAGQTGDTSGNAVLGVVTTNGGAITVNALNNVSLAGAQNASGGDVVITAQNGNITGAGLVTGNNVTLDSNTGIGTGPGDRVNTAAQTLAARSRVSGGVFLAQANAVSLATIGGVTNSAAGGGAYNITSVGAITVNNGINTAGSGATTLTTTVGGIAIGVNDVGNGSAATTLASADAITGTSGTVRGTDVILSGSAIGTPAEPLQVDAATLNFNSGGAVSISEANDTVLTGTNTADSLTLASAGSITDAAGTSVTVTNAASLSGTAITLADDAGDTLSAGTNASFSASGLGGISVGAAGTVNLGSLTTSTSAVGASTTVTEASGLTSVTVSTNDGDVNIDFGADSVTYTAAGDTLNFSAGVTDVGFTNSTGIELTGANSANNLSLVAGGAITGAAGTSVTATGNASFSGTSITLGDDPADALSVTGNASFAATDGNVSIGAPASVGFGTLTFNATGNVSIREDGSMVLTGTNTANELTLNSTGSITDAPGTSVTANANASLMATDSITLADDASDVLSVTGQAILLSTTGDISIGALGTANFGAVNFNAAGTVSIREGSDTAIFATNLVNGLTLTSTGTITDQAGTSLTVTNAASLSGTSITLGDDPGDTTNFGTLTFNSPGTVSINENSDTMLTGTNTANSLTLTSAGSITDAAGTSLTVTGAASLSGTSITLGDNAGDTTNFGSLTFSSAGAVSISEDSETILAGTNTADSLTLSSAGTITDAADTSLTVTNAASLSGTSITLGDNAGDTTNFGSLTFSAAGAVNIIEDSDTVLAGTNTAGSVGLTSAGALTVNGSVTTTNGSITLTADSLTNNATISNGGGGSTGNIVLVANDFDLVGAGGSIVGGNAAVVLTPRNSGNTFGIESAGDTTLTNADLATITTSNFIVLGSANLGFTGSTTIGANNQVDVANKNIAFLRANAPGTITIGADGLTTSGNVLVNAGGGAIISEGGTIHANQLALRASTGIGTSTDPVKTSANTLAVANVVAGGAFVAEADGVSLAALSLILGGNPNNIGNVVIGGGGYELTAGGTINVGAGGVNTGGIGATTLTTTGDGNNISIGVNDVGNANAATTLVSAGNITGTTGTVRGTAVTLDSAAGVGTSPAAPLNTAATTLAARSAPGGGVFVAEADGVTLATIGGVENLAGGPGASYDLTAGGTIVVGSGGVNIAGTGSTRLETTAGDIAMGADNVGNLLTATTLIAAGSITGPTPGPGLLGVVQGTNVVLDSGTGVGSQTARVITSADTLAARSRTGGSVFVSEASGVSLNTIGGVTNSAAGGGAYDVTANGAITVDANVTTANGLIRLEGTSLINNATISNGGGANTANIVLRADAFDLNGAGAGQVQGGNAAVVVTPHTNTNSLGIESAGDTTLTQADLDAIHTSNFVVLGSANLGFVGNTTIGESALVNGNGKSLAFFRAGSAPITATTTIGAQGVSTTGDVIVSGGPGNIVSNGGIVAGNNVQLTASRGIGTLGGRINTSATTLAANNSGAAGSGIFISEANDVSLAAFTLTVGGINNTQANIGGTGTYDLTAAGTVTVGSGGANAVTSTGATVLTTTGAGHSIDIGANNVGNASAATTLDSSGNITGTTGVVSGTDVSLAATGDIGATLSPIQVSAGTLNFNSLGAVTISEGNDTVLTGINTANSLSLTSAGSITDAAGTSLTVTDNASFSAGANAITLDNAGAHQFGSLTFAGGAVTVVETNATELAGASTATSLSLTSGGAITDAGGATLAVTDNASFSAGANAITLDNAGAHQFGSLTFAGGAVTVVEANATVLSGTSNATSLSLTSGGSITDDDTANVTVAGNASFNAGANAITLNDTYSFGSLTFAGGAVTVVEANATELAGVSTATSLSLASGGAITDAAGATLAVTDNASFSAGANAITLDNAGAHQFGSLTFAGGAVTVVEANAMELAGASTATSLSLASGGAITDAAGATLTVTGNASLSGSSITLGDGAGDTTSFGSLTFNSAGAVSISEDGDTVLAGTNTADSLALTSAGSITDAAGTSLTVTNAVSLAGSSITLGDSAGDTTNFGSLTFNSTGAVSISEDSDTFLAGTNTADSLALTSAGSITGAAGTSLTVTLGASFAGTSITLANDAADVLDIGGTASFAGGSITIGAAGEVDFGSLTFNSPGAVVINEDCCTELTGTSTAGTLNLTTSGALTDTGGASVTVAGDATFTAQSITLADSGGNVLNIGGLATFAAPGGISVGAAGAVNFGSLNFNSADAVSISEDSATALTGDNTAASLVLSSAGAITEVGTSLVVTGNASFSGTSINLGNNPGDTVNFGSLTFNSTGAVSISEDSATLLSGASTAGSLTLASTGSVAQAPGAALVVNGAGSINAGANAITLTNAGNDFVGTLSLKGTVVNVTDTNGISVMLDTGETVIIANGSLGSTGDLSIGGTTSGNLIAISNGGVVEWTNLTVGSSGSPKAALLIAAQPNRTITGPGSAGNALDPATTYSKLANATGGTVNVPGGEFVLIADNLPRNPASPDLPTITAETAVLDVQGLTPGARVTIKLNGQLRLLADKGVFRFTGTSELPGGVTTLDPKKVNVFIGNVSITSTEDQLRLEAAVGNAARSAITSASADARQSFGTDSVTQQIDMGFAGDVGIAPTMGHSVPLQGEIISTPEGVTESKGGQ
jgi:filamentous hemagglutinin family protein